MSVDDRARRAAENILENSSLTGDLMDDEAGVLLDWALNLAERFARNTRALDDIQAQPVIDEGLKALRRTMRRIGRLIGNLPQLDPDIAQERLETILEAAARVPDLRVQMPADVPAELNALRDLPPGAALRRVLTWFSLEEEQSEGKQ